MRRVLTVLFVIAVAVQLAVAQSKDRASDRSAVEATARLYQETWNRHDMAALAALMAEDVDYVTVQGSPGWQRGRTQVQTSNELSHKVLFKNSVMRVSDTKVRFIRPDIAVAHVRWETRGDAVPNQKPGTPRTGINVWMLEKRGGQWLIVVSQNTEDKGTPRGLGNESFTMSRRTTRAK